MTNGVNSLAAWLSYNGKFPIVPQTGSWLVVYEFSGKHLLICASDAEKLDEAAHDKAVAEMRHFIVGFPHETVEVRFRRDKAELLFCVNQGEWRRDSFIEVLEHIFGSKVFSRTGARKEINLPSQVKSPFQYWQRSVLSHALIAQDVDAWLDPAHGSLTALEFKQVKSLDGWTPYRADRPNFASLLRMMRPGGNLVVVAAPQGAEVTAYTPVRPFLLSLDAQDAGHSFRLPATNAKEFGALLDGRLPPSVDLPRLESGEWH